MLSRLAQKLRQLGDVRCNPPGLHREKRRKSSAGCFVKRSAKLFGKGSRRRQIEKAPAVINLPVSERSTSKSQRGVVQLVKTDNLTVQFDIQSIRGDGHLDNKGVFRLVGGRLTGSSK
jgi:hypothetical protein